MKKAAVILVVILMPLALVAGNVFGELGLGYRTIADSNLTDVYGSGGLNFSLNLGYKIGHPFTLLLETGYFSKEGKTIGLEEKTTFSYIPFILKGRYNINSGNLTPYVGAGVGYVAYKVKNDSPFLEDVSKGTMGFVVETGVCYKIQENFGFLLNAGYLYAKAKPFDVERNIGGVLFSAGLRVKF